MDKIFSIVTMQINPGSEQEFRAAAASCFEGVQEDPSGTDAYEWFISADGSTATVLEIYDDVAALQLHGKQVGKAIPAVMKLVQPAITFAGGVPPEVLETYQARRPNITYAGKRLLGLRRSPAPSRIAENPGQRIFAIARFTVHPGKELEFRALAEKCFEHVSQNEPETSGYEWFLNEAGTECLTLDIYDSPTALAAHMVNAGPSMAKILKIVDSKVEILGNLAKAAVASFNPGLGFRYAGQQFQGLL